MKKDYNLLSKRSKTFEIRNKELETEVTSLLTIVNKPQSDRESQTDPEKSSLNLNSNDIGIVGKVKFTQFDFSSKSNGFFYYFRAKWKP